jgi:hypothetical protein
VDQETLHGQVSDYRLYEAIASGGFGSVSIGRDTATNVPVAIKRLHPHLKNEPGFVERFEKEAATVRGLVHPNIVRLLDQGRDAEGVPFLVMEWVEGLTVGDWLKRRGKYASAEVVDVGCQVLEGLNAAWSRRVVHRDIKPANLMVTPSGRVKIMDFGVAKDLELATLAGSSGIIGTPAYMAPEQLRGQPLDCRADLYSLGITLYLMASGRLPFEGPSFADYFRQHLEQEPPRVEDLAPEVDRGLAAVLHKALAKAPADRFESPAEMLGALRSTAEPCQDATVVAASPSGSAQATVAGRPQVTSGHAVAPGTPQGVEATPAVIGRARVGVPGGRRVAWWKLTAAVLGVVVVVFVGGAVVYATQPRVGTLLAAEAATPASTSPIVTTPQADGTLFKDPLKTDADAALLRKNASASSYLVGRAPDDTFAIQKLTGDNAAAATAVLPLTVSDGVLGVDVSIAQRAQTGVVLLGCRHQAPANSRYQVALTPATGRVVLSQVNPGAQPRPLGEPQDASALLHTDGTPDRLELECNGPTLTARVNGQEVATAENSDYAVGGWLIGAGAPGAPFEAHFTDLQVSRP